MLDVHLRLKQLAPHHLPQKLDSPKGIRHMFPPGRPCNVSSMKDAIYTFGKMSAQTPSGEVMGTYLVMADWCGNWFFDFYIVEQAGQSGVWGAGFVFTFSTDKVGHGYTITGNYSTGSDSPGCTSQSVSGNDPWIRDNWAKVTAGGARVGIGNSTGAIFSNSPQDIVAYTLEGTGFASLENLGGAQPSALSQGANVNGECWFAGSDIWGVSATYPWQGGVQRGGATVELGPGYLFTPAYVPPEALSGK